MDYFNNWPLDSPLADVSCQRVMTRVRISLLFEARTTFQHEMQRLSFLFSARPQGTMTR